MAAFDPTYTDTQGHGELAPCPNADKHDAIERSLNRVIAKLNLTDKAALVTGIIDTDDFLQPWIEYRDIYLLNPMFNDEGLCAGGDKIDHMFEDIKREVNGDAGIISPLHESADGRSHTIRLYSSLVRGLSKRWFSKQQGDSDWPRRLCKELYLLVKHLRIEYVHGHGFVMDVIEERYPSLWLNPELLEQDMISEDDDGSGVPEHNPSHAQRIDLEQQGPGLLPSVEAKDADQEETSGNNMLATYQQQVKSEENDVSESERIAPDAYFTGFTQSTSSSESCESHGQLKMPEAAPIPAMAYAGVSHRSISPKNGAGSTHTSDNRPVSNNCFKIPAKKTSRFEDDSVLSEEMEQVKQLFSLTPERTTRDTSLSQAKMPPRRESSTTSSHVTRYPVTAYPSRAPQYQMMSPIKPPAPVQETRTMLVQYPSTTPEQEVEAMPLEHHIKSEGSPVPSRHMSNAPMEAAQYSFPKSPSPQLQTRPRSARPRQARNFRIPFLMSDSESGGSPGREIDTPPTQFDGNEDRHQIGRTSCFPAPFSNGSPGRNGRFSFSPTPVSNGSVSNGSPRRIVRVSSSSAPFSTGSPSRTSRHPGWKPQVPGLLLSVEVEAPEESRQPTQGPSFEQYDFGRTTAWSVGRSGGLGFELRSPSRNTSPLFEPEHSPRHTSPLFVPKRSPRQTRPLFEPERSPRHTSPLFEPEHSPVLASSSRTPATQRQSSGFADLLGSVPNQENDTPSTPKRRHPWFSIDLSEARKPPEVGLFDVNTPFSPLPQDDPFC